MNNIEKLKDIIQKDNNIVFFGGAGVSTESGIPDFRSVDGLYNQRYKYKPEYILSIDAFEKIPEIFWAFYRDKILLDGILPNKGHMALAKLEREGKLKCIITQNIDNLHEAAGSNKVFHLHGNVLMNHCPNCKKIYSLEDIKVMPVTPICECGTIIKPDITLYGEQLPQAAWNNSLQHIIKANTLIIAGTSLSVYPAATIIDYFSGDHLIIINRDSTSRDTYADVLIHGNFSEVLGTILD
jgi:NAD-dependent deacetylase